MHDSKLMTLLKSLSTEEFKNLKKFIMSPFFNTNEQVIDLYRYISKYYPKWNSRMYSKEIVFREVFPEDKKYNSKKLSNLMSEFSLLTEEFIFQKALKANSPEKEKIRLNAFANRGLTASLEKQFKKLNSLLENPVNKGLGHYNSKFLVNHMLYFDPSTQTFNSGNKGLNEAMDSLDIFYFLGKLQISYEMKTRERLLGEKYTIGLLDNVLNVVSKKNTNFPPALKIYFHLTELHLYDIDKEYFKAKDIFLKHLGEIAPSDRFKILLFLINFIVKKGNNNPLFSKESFELYEFGLKNNILIANGKLSGPTFTNIVHQGIRFERFSWTFKFIKDYQQYLDSDIREQIKTLGLAIVHFAQKDYSSVRKLIINHAFPGTIYKIRAKSLLLRAIYEELSTDNTQFTLFISQSNSFEKFLRRNKKLTERDKYLKFVQLLRLIAKRKTEYKGHAPEKSKIKQKALAFGSFANKAWVWEKINEL